MSDEWEGLLDPDERVIWQGAPDATLRLAWTSIGQPIVGVIFPIIAFSGFNLGETPGFANLIIPAIFSAVGLYELILIHPWKAYVRKNTFYTLTNKRAFIGMSLPFKGRTLESYPLSRDTQVTLRDGVRASIHFAERMKRTRRSEKAIPIGFEDLSDGRRVYSMVRSVQDGAA